MQKRIQEVERLLDEKGMLANPGYATKPIFIYDRKDIKAPIWRIKEWDYYACLTDHYGVTFTIADLGYSAMISAVFLDFDHKKLSKKVKLGWFPFGKMKLPLSSEYGDVSYHHKGFDFHFKRDSSSRVLTVHIQNFEPGKDLSATLTLKDLHDETMVIATPWMKAKRAFYYNQKINCMPTSGLVKIGEQEYNFYERNAFSVLDWGRGVWTYKNTWYWASISGKVNGKRFGMNLGYGFGDNQHATENMIFMEGIAHKLDEVKFEIDESNFMKPWRFTDNQMRLELIMEPIVDREDNMNLGIIKNLGHQVFGRFSGFFILDDGTKIEIKNQIGFAEKIMNHY